MKYNILIIFAFAFSLNIDAQKTKTDSTNVNTKTFYSVANLRPVNINKGNYLFSLQNEFVKYYKVYNSQTGSIEKKSDKVVINDVAFNLQTIYGINNKINLIAFIPIIDDHHYSPMLFSKGIGLGDIQIGINYNLINKPEKSFALRFDAGFSTGKSTNLSPEEIALGTGAFSAKLSGTGLYTLNKFDFVYSAYYQLFSKNFSGIDVPDEAGIYAFLYKDYKTEYGKFGLESGINSFIKIPSANFVSGLTLKLFIGARYAYNDKLNISFAIPYTILQQNAFLTKYNTILQFDYLLNKKTEQ